MIVWLGKVRLGEQTVAWFSCFCWALLMARGGTQWCLTPPCCTRFLAWRLTTFAACASRLCTSSYTPVCQ